MDPRLSVMELRVGGLVGVRGWGGEGWRRLKSHGGGQEASWWGCWLISGCVTCEPILETHQLNR